MVRSCFDGHLCSGDSRRDWAGGTNVSTFNQSLYKKQWGLPDAKRKSCKGLEGGFVPQQQDLPSKPVLQSVRLRLDKNGTRHPPPNRSRKPSLPSLKEYPPWRCKHAARKDYVLIVTSTLHQDIGHLSLRRGE